MAKTSWTSEQKKSFTKLDKNIKADVVVIGGGITGVLSSYLLAKSGKKVVLLEKGLIASGATNQTTAHITQIIDTDARDVIDMIGLRKAKLVFRSGLDAINLIEKIVKKEKIECDFTRCSLFAIARSKDEMKDLEEELEAYKELDIKASIKKESLGIKSPGYIEVPKQAKFHPLKFVNAVARKATKEGSRIYENTSVDEVIGDREIIVKTKKGSVVAKEVIYATYLPLKKHADLFAKKGLYISYVIEAKLPKGKVNEGLYEDLANPYHYLRIDPFASYDRAIFGGDDHRHELPISESKNFKKLEKTFKKWVGGIDYKITKKWIGPIVEPTDGLAYIGKLRENQYVATGFSGTGMTYSAIAAQLFHDLILKKNNKYESVYDPNRIPTAKQLYTKGIDYTGEFIGGFLKNSL